ncbi:hypothetical protein Angca_008090, partial [Angiostrongylus cantonensis]
FQVSSSATMSRLADASYAFLKKFSFDGLDIDWEFPSWSSDSQKTDRQRFPLLLKALREKFGTSLFLTVSVSGPPTITKVAYKAESFNRYVDLVNVMNYDFHIFSYFNPFVGFNAPLRKLVIKRFTSFLCWFCSNFLLTLYPFVLKVFGIPTYGRGYRLINWRVNKPYSLASAYMVVLQTCKLAEQSSAYTYVWNNQAASPYLHGSDKLWLSFEDVKSIRAKTQYAQKLGIAGVMVYDIGSDDVYGLCGNGTYPLLRAI